MITKECLLAKSVLQSVRSTTRGIADTPHRLVLRIDVTTDAAWGRRDDLLFALFLRPPNARTKLRGQGPRGYGSAARRLPRQTVTTRAMCSRRDAAPVLFGQGASAPSRSRAATA